MQQKQGQYTHSHSMSVRLAIDYSPFRSIVTQSFIAVMLRVVLAPFLYITINVSAFSSRCTWMQVFRVLWMVMDRTLSPVNDTDRERATLLERANPDAECGGYVRMSPEQFTNAWRLASTPI